MKYLISGLAAFILFFGTACNFVRYDNDVYECSYNNGKYYFFVSQNSDSSVIKNPKPSQLIVEFCKKLSQEG